MRIFSIFKPSRRQDKPQTYSLREAQAFIEGIYCGDNPYLSERTIAEVLQGWRNNGQVSAVDYALLRRVNLDHVATLVISRRDEGCLFPDDRDQLRFCEIASYIPKDADMAMTLMERVAVAERMELKPQEAIVDLRLYEGTAFHCGEYLCKIYDSYLRMRYELQESGICQYKVM